jgi:fibronectin type 3 domain-containing protein
LTWSASTGAASYKVYRGKIAGAQRKTPIATGVTATSFTNTGLTKGTKYFYKVAAVNASGTSGLSNEASATPLAPNSGTVTDEISRPLRSRVRPNVLSSLTAGITVAGASGG